MRILILSKESRGGTGHLINQLQLIRCRERDIETYFYKHDPASPVTSGFNLLGNNYPVSHTPSLLKVWLFLRNCIATYTLLQKKRYDTIFTCDHYAAIQVLLLRTIGVLPGARVYALENNNIGEVISQKPVFFYRYFLSGITRLLYRRADKLVVTSRGLLNRTARYLSFPKKQMVLIPNSIDTHDVGKNIRKKAPSLSLMTKQRGWKIVTVGRLEKQKDFDTVIRAVVRVHRGGTNAHLYIIGEGSQRSRLEDLVRKLHAASIVHFLGWQRNVYPFLAASDVFLFASTHEGFGTVLVEAMACGLPVIATDTPHGPAEILGHGEYGWLVRMHDDHAMADKLIMLLKNKKKRLSLARSGKERSKAYDKQAMLHQYEELFSRYIP